MSKWEMVKLGDITSLITKGTTPTTIGFQFQDSGVNFVKIECITEDGRFIKEKFEHISEECNDKMKRSILCDNDILFSIAGALGRTAIVNSSILPANTNQALAIIRIRKDNIDYRYINWTLRSSLVNKQFQKQKQGVAQLNLSLKNISDLEIPLPPLNIQKHIVDILDKTQEIIDCYKKQLEELDTLVKSTFYDMFGDPNDNRFDKRILPELARNNKNAIKRGPFGGSLKKDDFVESGYLVYEQRHAIHNDFEYEKYYITSEKYEAMIDFMVQPKDLIISCSGVTLGRISEVPINAKQGIINQALLKLSLDSNIVNSTFFIHLFRNKVIQDILFGVSRGSGIPNFPSMSVIKSIGFITPPIELQNKFANIVKNIEEQKTIVKQSLTESQNLFNSLMSKYFD